MIILEMRNLRSARAYRLYKSIGPVQDTKIENTSKGSTGTATVPVPKDLKIPVQDPVVH